MWPCAERGSLARYGLPEPRVGGGLVVCWSDSTGGPRMSRARREGSVLRQELDGRSSFPMVESDVAEAFFSSPLALNSPPPTRPVRHLRLDLSRWKHLVALRPQGTRFVVFSPAGRNMAMESDSTSQTHRSWPAPSTVLLSSIAYSCSVPAALPSSSVFKPSILVSTSPFT